MTARAGKGWEAVRLDELEAIPVAEGLVWHPVRRRLGIRAFGVNAYTSESVGSQVVEQHDESDGAGGGHEELYLVMRGRATFTVGGDRVDASAGTLLFVADPTLERVAVSEEEGTLVIAIGGEPGRAFEVRAWESSFTAARLLRDGRLDEAIELLTRDLRDRPGDAAALYNLACAEARGGRSADALEHLRAALAAVPAYAERARVDPDLDSIRGEPGFPRVD